MPSPPPVPRDSLAANPTEAIRRAAQALGFARVGFCAIDLPQRGGEALLGWLRAGHHGEMAYMERHGDRTEAAYVFAQARTVITVALPYGAVTPAPATTGGDGPRGVVARYARGADYHMVVRQKLEALGRACAQILGTPVLYRPCVDSAPLLEREAAAASGLGFIAKSTMVITPGVGTYTLLGELLVDAALPPDEPQKSRCGACTACLTACPTGAFVGPYILDARRCISYLTIELAGPIPVALRPLMGQMVFGCDICQEVCPFNHSPKARPSAPELAARPALTAPLLSELLNLTSSGYRRWVTGTALRRVSRQQLARNAAVALGNSGDPTVIPKLVDALREHRSPLVRQHVAWALGQFRDDDAAAALARARHEDSDADVRNACAQALGSRRGADPGPDDAPTPAC